MQDQAVPRSQLADALAGPAAEAGSRSVPVRVAGAGAAVDSALDPTGALTVDVDATAEDLTGAAWAPAALWRHVTGGGATRPVVTVDDVRALALTLPRTSEALVRDRVKFRVGRIVYLAFSRDETVMGFAFPRDERDALVESEPDKFMLPGRSDLRYNWVLVRLATIDAAEMRELVLDAWRMVVPRRVAAAYDDRLG